MSFEVKIVRDQIYSTAGGAARLADLYLPQGMDRRPQVIVWVHGGGWRFGDRNLAPDLVRWLAERGFAMVSFDYRLSDEAVFPAQVIDVKTVVRWVRSIEADFDLDADSIGLWGSSAGGHLSCCAALSGKEEFLSGEHEGFSSAVQAVVDAYGPTNFARIDEDRVATPPKVADAETVLVRNVLPARHPESFESRLIGISVRADAPEVLAASPLSYVRRCPTQFLLLHGQSDALVPWTQAQFLYDALVSAGNEPTMVLFERFGHGFLMNSDLDSTDSGETTIYQAGRLAHASLEPLKCFTLCEQFFRYALARPSDAASVFVAEAP